LSEDAPTDAGDVAILHATIEGEREAARLTQAERSNMLLFGMFAAMALMLSAVGLYGVISYAVTRRTHEVGIGMALGADQGAILRLIIGQGMRVVAIGVALGIGWPSPRPG